MVDVRSKSTVIDDRNRTKKSINNGTEISMSVSTRINEPWRLLNIIIGKLEVRNICFPNIRFQKNNPMSKLKELKDIPPNAHYIQLVDSIPKAYIGLKLLIINSAIKYCASM